MYFLKLSLNSSVEMQINVIGVIELSVIIGRVFRNKSVSTVIDLQIDWQPWVHFSPCKRMDGHCSFDLCVFMTEVERSWRVISMWVSSCYMLIDKKPLRPTRQTVSLVKAIKSLRNTHELVFMDVCVLHVCVYNQDIIFLKVRSILDFKKYIYKCFAIYFTVGWLFNWKILLTVV